MCPCAVKGTRISCYEPTLVIAKQGIEDDVSGQWWIQGWSEEEHNRGHGVTLSGSQGGSTSSLGEGRLRVVS